jgi:hypothetical protein
VKCTFRITNRLLQSIVEDLQRPHDYAFERVGFISCRFGLGPNRHLLSLAHSYSPVSDEDYIEDPAFGALIDSSAFRKALQIAYTHRVGLFHVHLHSHSGAPRPSNIDLQETAKFLPDFFNVRPNLPHGALVLSRDSVSGRIWLGARHRPRPFREFIIVGMPLRRILS